MSFWEKADKIANKAIDITHKVIDYLESEQERTMKNVRFKVNDADIKLRKYERNINNYPEETQEKIRKKREKIDDAKKQLGI